MTQPPRPNSIGIPLRPSLVGRDAEVAALDEQLALARSGAFRVVLVTGEPGIGKSRLVNELAERHRDSAVVVGSRAFELGMTYSLALWVEAFERMLGSAPAAEVRRLSGSSLHDLALVLPSARRALATAAGKQDPGPDPGSGREPDPERLLRALTELLDNLSADRPVIVILDDVHNADTSSWQALYHIARRLPDRPVLVLATARTAELARHLAAGQVLAGLEQDDVLARLGLLPLADESVAALARAVLGSGDVPLALVSWLSERSRGYPLFVLGLLRALLEQGADLAQPRLARVPESVADRVALLVGRLDPPDRELLEVLAVIGGRVDLDGLARALGRPLDRLGVPLERLTRSRLVVEYEASRRLSYEIAHPLVQDAVYQSIGGARRRMFHRLVGRALVTVGNFGAAAPHFVRSADSGDPEAVETLVRAVRQAEERNLYQETLPLLAALLDLMGPDDQRWLDVLEAMTWRAEWVVDHLVEDGAATAIAVMRRIERQLAASGERLREGIVQFRLAAFLAIGAGQPADAAAACRRAQELFAAEGHADLALLAQNELGWIRYCAGDLPGQRTLVLDVCEEAEKRGDQMALIQALGALGYVAALQGRFGEAGRHLRRSTGLAQAAQKRYRYVWNLTMSGLALALAWLADGRTTFEAAMREPEAADAATPEIFAQCDWLSGRSMTSSNGSLSRPRAGRWRVAGVVPGRRPSRPGRRPSAGSRMPPRGCSHSPPRRTTPVQMTCPDGAAGCHGRPVPRPPWPVTPLPGTSCSIVPPVASALWTPGRTRRSCSSTRQRSRSRPAVRTRPSPTRGGSRSSPARSKARWSGRWRSSPAPMRCSPRLAGPTPPVPPPRPRTPWTGSAAGSSARWPPRSPGSQQRTASPPLTCSPGRRMGTTRAVRSFAGAGSPSGWPVSVTAGGVRRSLAVDPAR